MSARFMISKWSYYVMSCYIMSEFIFSFFDFKFACYRISIEVEDYEKNHVLGHDRRQLLGEPVGTLIRRRISSEAHHFKAQRKRQKAADHSRHLRPHKGAV
ncbi:hypothetical protein RvY_03209 [Ramazzottius varieornatus]|uniref:Uncharacterized protein n=1 Tax=Ramazzottius varieornatus TaxID=947166 RepID=A0A1D1UM91_RAMVA|nr:hypothetical protein RvY_03209 [Ramazzottius varieornatus]